MREGTLLFRQTATNPMVLFLARIAVFNNRTHGSGNIFYHGWDSNDFFPGRDQPENSLTRIGALPPARKLDFLPYSFAGSRLFSGLTSESPLEMTGSHMSDMIRFPDLSKLVPVTPFRIPPMGRWKGR